MDSPSMVAAIVPAVTCFRSSCIQHFGHFGDDHFRWLDPVLRTTAINLIRLDAWWTGTPLHRTKTTHLARLGLTLAA